MIGMLELWSLCNILDIWLLLSVILKYNIPVKYNLIFFTLHHIFIFFDIAYIVKNGMLHFLIDATKKQCIHIFQIKHSKYFKKYHFVFSYNDLFIKRWTLLKYLVFIYKRYLVGHWVQFWENKLYSIFRYLKVKSRWLFL